MRLASGDSNDGMIAGSPVAIAPIAAVAENYRAIEGIDDGNDRDASVIAALDTLAMVCTACVHTPRETMWTVTRARLPAGPPSSSWLKFSSSAALRLLAPLSTLLTISARVMRP